jgi:inhibitor of cysteine peptidase
MLVLVLSACSDAGSNAEATATAGNSGSDTVSVEQIEVQMLESFPVQVNVIARGQLPDACAFVERADQSRQGDRFEVSLTLARRPDARCAPMATPFEHTIALDVVGLAAGQYTVHVNGVEGSFELQMDNELTDAMSLLDWQGYGVWGDEDATRCKTLQIGADGQVAMGYCGEALTTTSFDRPEFEEMVDRLAPFELKTPTDDLVFQGRGQIAGPEWQRAVLAWVHWTFGESWAGRACAACRTALSWHLGPLSPEPTTSSAGSSQCAHLTVLDHGYAYAEVRPCEGGPLQTQTNGWLETAEWVQLDEWLYGRAALYSGDNYLAGLGSQSMTEAESAQLEALARSIYARLTGSPLPELGGSINGWVWHDLCALGPDGQPGPTAPLPGCVDDPNGARRADGIKESHEPPIDGVKVQLGSGACPSLGLAEAITVDSDLSYTFTGLDAGTYCVSIDPLQEPNLSRLVPGGWTYPTMEDGTASVTVVLNQGENRFDVNFGWDYQFLPAWSMPLDSPQVGAFLNQLRETVQRRDAIQLPTLLGNTFMLAGWRSEGTAYAPDAAVEQLLTNYVGQDTVLKFDANKDLSALLGGSDPLTILRADVFGVNAIYASGWGLTGQDEVILYLAPRPDGSPYWYGVLIGSGGFAAQDLTLPPDGGAAASCPAPAADTRRLTHTRHGYCLLYPSAYKVEKPNADETDLVIGSLLNVQDPRVNIVVELANGRSADEMADARLAELAGFDVERSRTMVGGVEAVVLDKLPGQEINRQVWFAQDGRLYHLTFMPADESLGETYARMEALYTLITGSFTFIPASDVVVPGSDCLEATADTQPLTFEAYNFCMLYPTGYDVDEPTANQIVFYVGSLLNVEHPKLFIEVGDAGGRTAEQVTGDLAAEVEASMPGYVVERTFGLTLGYEPAWVLENMPGQDISRQAVVVHDGRLYKLTFVPASPDAGPVYAEMEQLYTVLVNSFRFLR